MHDDEGDGNDYDNDGDDSGGHSSIALCVCG